MPIVSGRFAVFVLLVLAGYARLEPRRQLGWLLAASWIYQAAWSWHLAVVAAAATSANLTLLPRVRTGGRRWLVAGIAGNLALLVALRAHPIGGGLATIGASFYLLRAISLLVDVSTGVLGRCTRTEAALYLLYFPAVVAGPVEKAGVFVDGLRRPRSVDDVTVARSLGLVVLGVVRKLVIADPLAAVLPAAAFVAPATLDGSVLATALVGYAFVLYNDFAGYTDVVRGVSGLFGIALPPNFVQPFFSRSFSEFWTRWHASLMRWLQTYVYMPLSRALLRRWSGLRSTPNLVLPPFVTLVASGAWHAATPGFVLWGAIHGAYLTSERVWSVYRPRGVRGEPGLVRQLLSGAAVFLLGTLVLALFRLPLGAAVDFWQALTAWHAPAAPDLAVAIPIAGSLALDAMQRTAGDELPFIGWPRAARIALLAGAMLACFWFSRAGAPAPFVYQGF